MSEVASPIVEGFLWKQEKNWKDWKKRYIVLQNDKLKCYKSLRKFKNKKQPLTDITLIGYGCTEYLPSNEKEKKKLKKFKFLIQLIHPDFPKYYFASPDFATGRRWMGNLIRSCKWAKENFIKKHGQSISVNIHGSDAKSKKKQETLKKLNLETKPLFDLSKQSLETNTPKQPLIIKSQENLVIGIKPPNLINSRIENLFKLKKKDTSQPIKKLFMICKLEYREASSSIQDERLCIMTESKLNFLSLDPNSIQKKREFLIDGFQNSEIEIKKNNEYHLKFNRQKKPPIILVSNNPYLIFIISMVFSVIKNKNLLKTFVSSACYRKKVFLKLPRDICIKIVDMLTSLKQQKNKKIFSLELLFQNNYLKVPKLIKILKKKNFKELISKMPSDIDSLISLIQLLIIIFWTIPDPVVNIDTNFNTPIFEEIDDPFNIDILNEMEEEKTLKKDPRLNDFYNEEENEQINIGKIQHFLELLSSTLGNTFFCIFQTIIYLNQLFEIENNLNFVTIALIQLVHFYQTKDDVDINEMVFNIEQQKIVLTFMLKQIKQIFKTFDLKLNFPTLENGKEREKEIEIQIETLVIKKNKQWEINEKEDTFNEFENELLKIESSDPKKTKSIKSDQYSDSAFSNGKLSYNSKNTLNNNSSNNQESLQTSSVGTLGLGSMFTFNNNIYHSELLGGYDIIRSRSIFDVSENKSPQNDDEKSIYPQLSHYYSQPLPLIPIDEQMSKDIMDLNEVKQKQKRENVKLLLNDDLINLNKAEHGLKYFLKKDSTLKVKQALADILEILCYEAAVIGLESAQDFTEFSDYFESSFNYDQNKIAEIDPMFISKKKIDEITVIENINEGQKTIVLGNTKESSRLLKFRFKNFSRK
ncbi:dual adapter for phosphotyrosine and 3-phosphotyrosine and 3-phosphoinositide [Anaeramoeba flamelloides]|uniref:Dual adapter for phosphotyrosine and 3-phosphotyrosine and 3-phosphoinositide n=1 Tax=Anaeramoeba flamelloides TaxID=1746091 RepID=A0AAV8A8X6_9EUKA|nr:dual adapter for phosphotyrosine and 3-phosphotyrosine and 3-phosphoinositide [Anaeramoeba flamelloides]